MQNLNILLGSSLAPSHGLEILLEREHPGHGQIIWVQPTLVAQVKFRQFTRRCRLTEAAFKGIRRDLTPEDLGEVLEKLKAIGGGQ